MEKHGTLKEMIADFEDQGLKVELNPSDHNAAKESSKIAKSPKGGTLMQMSNIEMGNHLDILVSLKEEGKLGYAIARNMRKLRDASQEYLDKRYELLTKYDLITEEGRLNRDNPEGMQKYTEDMGDIPQIKHDVDIFQVTEDEFCSGSLTSDQMSELLWMVKEEEEDDG